MRTAQKSRLPLSDTESPLRRLVFLSAHVIPPMRAAGGYYDLATKEDPRCTLIHCSRFSCRREVLEDPIKRKLLHGEPPAVGALPSLLYSRMLRRAPAIASMTHRFFCHAVVCVQSAHHNSCPNLHPSRIPQQTRVDMLSPPIPLICVGAGITTRELECVPNIQGLANKRLGGVCYIRLYDL